MRRLAPWLHRAGMAVAVFGFGKFHAVRHSYDYTTSSRFAWSIAYIVLLAVAAYGVGLPDLARGRRRALLLASLASGLGGMGISLAQLLTNDILLPRAVVFGAGLVLIPWGMLCAALAGDGEDRDSERDRVVVVAGVGAVDALRDELDHRPERPSAVVGALTPPDALPSRLSARPLCELVTATGATIVVLDRQAQAEESIVAQAADLHARGVRVRTLSLFYEEWLGKLPLGEIEHLSLMFDIGEIHRSHYVRLRRLVDVVLGLAGLVALAGVVPVVWLANLLGNRGPLFFRQPRVGKGGHVFTMVKFRSMRPLAAPVSEGEWTSRSDPRITRFGRLLRSSHLDELPQVVNVLKGDLSIVGPRPEQPHYVEELTEKIPFYNHRHLVRPGLTGWAQVKFRYAASELETTEKLQYDFFYLRRQSLGLDLRIVGRTVRSVFTREGR